MADGLQDAEEGVHVLPPHRTVDVLQVRQLRESIREHPRLERYRERLPPRYEDAEGLDMAGKVGVGDDSGEYVCAALRLSLF